MHLFQEYEFKNYKIWIEETASVYSTVFWIETKIFNILNKVKNSIEKQKFTKKKNHASLFFPFYFFILSDGSNYNERKNTKKNCENFSMKKLVWDKGIYSLV